MLNGTHIRTRILSKQQFVLTESQIHSPSCEKKFRNKARYRKAGITSRFIDAMVDSYDISQRFVSHQVSYIVAVDSSGSVIQSKPSTTIECYFWVYLLRHTWPNNLLGIHSINRMNLNY
jgi:hypothetical protein